MPLDNKALQLAFDMLVVAARFGRRCPVTAREGVAGLPSGATSALAKAGKIRIEIYAKNWRVVEITAGPYAGKRTAPPPNAAWAPYLIIDHRGSRRIAA